MTSTQQRTDGERAGEPRAWDEVLGGANGVNAIHADMPGTRDNRNAVSPFSIISQPV